MDTRNIRKSEYDDAKDLWAVSFGDSNDFINNYFANKVEEQNIFGTFEGGRLVSMLIALPRVFMLRGNPCKSVFIAGCCTDPESRNRGYMRELLCHASEVLRESGSVFGFLHPFNHDFYRKLGWATVSDMMQLEFCPENESRCTCTTDSYKPHIILDLYKCFAAGFDYYFDRNTDDMNARLNEHFCDGGHILYDKDMGWYCLYFIEENLVEVVENTCRNDGEYSKMLYELSAYSKPIRYLRPGICGSGEYTMMKVFDEVEAVRLFGLSDSIAADINGAICDEIRNGRSLFFEQY